ncbi:MAG: trigger factor [Burkholderiaceae bacterium]|nr:trigger factor [Sulfuritalea sp.]MCF8174705.1 trigger factor [Burkholderiaceae bacterium]MCF8183426.1 trigger factor [Polynucleobacter sp.]
MTDKATTDAVVEASSPLERRIEMTVALAEIEKDVEQRLKVMSRKVKVPGFRPGKVPMKMVAQQYGSQARSEAIGEAVEKAYGEKVREQNLRVAGYPRVEPKADASPGQLGFTAIFEVYPEITPADISSESIAKPTLSLTDVEVNKTLDVLRKQRTTYAETDRAAIKEDRLVIDFVGRKDGEEFQGGKAEDYAVTVGGGMMLPDFEVQLEGVKAGDTKSFDVTFPADYQAAELAGATVQFDMTVKKVEAPQIPEIDAEFAKQLGVADGDVAKMLLEVRSNLEREVKKRLQGKVKEQVMEALLKVNPLDVPKALVEMESQQMAEAARRDMESRGMAMKNIPVEPSWFTDQAMRRVKLGLLLAELVKAKDLHVKPEQVRAIVDEFAETFEDPKEVVRWYYSQPQRLAEAEALALENNVVDWVLANAKVNEAPIAFDELMGNAA